MDFHNENLFLYCREQIRDFFSISQEEGKLLLLFNVCSSDNIHCAIKGIELKGTISPIRPLSEEIRRCLDVIERSRVSSFPREMIELPKEFVSSLIAQSI